MKEIIRPVGTYSAREIKVIETTAPHGLGTIEEPLSTEHKYWSLDGNLLATSNENPKVMISREMNERLKKIYQEDALEIFDDNKIRSMRNQILLFLKSNNFDIEDKQVCEFIKLCCDIQQVLTTQIKSTSLSDEINHYYIGDKGYMEYLEQIKKAKEEGRLQTSPLRFKTSIINVDVI